MVILTGANVKSQSRDGESARLRVGGRVEAEEWAEAGTIAAALIKEQPDRSAYVGLAGAVAARMGDREAAMKHAVALSQLASESDGSVELRRAQLAALVGQREEAVDLLRDAFARGLSMSTALHRQMDLESLRGFAPFDALMRPKAAGS